MRLTTLSLLLILAVETFFGQKPGESNAVTSLVATERSFASMSVRDGMKKAFLTYLSDDAIVFRPGPLNGKSVWEKRKETTARLEWYPTIAFVCTSGELGYTSGPSIYTPEAHLDQPPGYGYFVTVWKKQENDEWRVALDLGTTTDAPQNPDTGLHIPVSFPTVKKGSVNLKTERRAVLDAEKSFSRIASVAGIYTAFQKFLLDDGKVYRPGKFPAQGWEALKGMLDKGPRKMQSQVAECFVSKSSDLAYTHGNYASSDSGYFVRIWRRKSPNTWKLAVEIISPISQEK